MPVAKVNARNFRFLLEPLITGTLQNVGHTLNQVRIAADANVDHFYNGWAVICLTSGVDAWIPRRIVSFLTATDDILVEPPFTAIPAGETYAIYPALFSAPIVGQAIGGGANFLDLAIAAGIRPDFWSGCTIELIGGVGGNVNQPKNKREIVDFVAANRRAFVSRPWEGAAPDSTTIYRIWPHLYFPCHDLEVVPDTGSIIFSNTPGGLASGAYSTGTGYGGERPETQDWYFEVAAAAAAVMASIRRWEG